MRAKDQNLFSSKRNIFLLILHPFLTWVFRLQEFTIEFITKFSHNTSICCYAYRKISKYWYWIIITQILSEEMLIPGQFYSFFFLSSLWGESWNLLLPPDCLLNTHDRGHLALLPPLHRQGGPGNYFSLLSLYHCQHYHWQCFHQSNYNIRQCHYHLR